MWVFKALPSLFLSGYPASVTTVFFHSFCCVCVCSHSVICDPLDYIQIGSLCPWDSLGKNTGVGCHSLLQGIFPTQELNACLPCFLHCRRILYLLKEWGRPSGCSGCTKMVLLFWSWRICLASMLPESGTLMDSFSLDIPETRITCSIMRTLHPFTCLSES